MTSSADKPQIINEKDCFYFESDHLAIKGNSDYGDVLKSLFLLQAQRNQLLKDYEEVVKLKNQALNDPLSIVEKLKKGEPLNVPDVFQVAEVPKVNWSKYNIPIPEHFLNEINDENLEQNESKKEYVCKNINGTGKKKTWTVEEQKRLQELLIKYPPEDVELNRFRKIAKALGNTTVQQVCSRVQKYFVKLYEMGLPIPGRIPKSINKKKTHKHQRHNHYLFKPSTFFPQLNIPVKMDDSEDCPGPSQNINSSNSNNINQQNYLLPNTYPDENDDNKTDLEKQIDLLKRAKNEKIKMDKIDYLHQHIGFSCDFCNEEPISGSRWHCSTCTQNSVDFCTDCIIAQMYEENSHPISHQFIIIRNNEKMSSMSSNSESSEETDSSSESTNGDSDMEMEVHKNDPTESDQSLSQPSTSNDNSKIVINNENNDHIFNYHEIFTHQQKFPDYFDNSLLLDE